MTVKNWKKPAEKAKNDIRDVGSIADLVLVFLVHLVQWYLVHRYPLVPTGAYWFFRFSWFSRFSRLK